MQLFPIQMPKASGTSVLGCKDSPVTAQAALAKGFWAPHEEDLGGCIRTCFHFGFHRGVPEQQCLALRATPQSWQQGWSSLICYMRVCRGFTQAQKVLVGLAQTAKSSLTGSIQALAFFTYSCCLYSLAFADQAVNKVWQNLSFFHCAVFFCLFRFTLFF